MTDLAGLVDNVRTKAPIIHSITNYVTVNDCANLLLACGASPIMADDPEEAAEIAALCDGVNLNIGTLNHHTIPSMLAAGRRANELGRPVVLDPVGAGASRLRTETAQRLIREVRFAVIRGNISEIKTLVCGRADTRGVDAGEADDSDDGRLALARTLAERTGAVVAVTGARDVISDGARSCVVSNGHPMMSRVTGTGCMLSALTAAYAAANPERLFEAACAAVVAMGLCGERAYAALGARDGNNALRGGIIDAVYRLDGQSFQEGARYEMR